MGPNLENLPIDQWEKSCLDLSKKLPDSWAKTLLSIKLQGCFGSSIRSERHRAAFLKTMQDCGVLYGIHLTGSGEMVVDYLHSAKTSIV